MTFLAWHFEYVVAHSRCHKVYSRVVLIMISISHSLRAATIKGVTFNKANTVIDIGINSSKYSNHLT